MIAVNPEQYMPYVSYIKAEGQLFDSTLIFGGDIEGNDPNCVIVQTLLDLTVFLAIKLQIK